MYRYLTIFVVLLGACGAKYHNELQTVCDCPSRAAKGADFVDVQLMCRDAWGKISSSRGKELLRSIVGVDYPEKGRLLQAAATEEGIPSCSMADLYTSHRHVQYPSARPTPAE